MYSGFPDVSVNPLWHSDNIEDLSGTVFYIGDPAVIISRLTCNTLTVWLLLLYLCSLACHQHPGRLTCPMQKTHLPHAEESHSLTPCRRLTFPMQQTHLPQCPHCTENPIYVFLKMKLRGLAPNSYILVSVNDL
jgi:hypothetical protein